MREKVNTAYFLNDPRKLGSMEDGEKELNRLRAVCMRWKKKQGADINITLGLSATNTEFVGKMGYDKPKNKGGKKQFICDEKIWRIDRNTGEVNKVTPDTVVAPHLHILVEGYGASSCAEHIIQSMPSIEIKLMKEDEEIKEPYTETELKKLLKKPISNRWAEWRSWAIINYFIFLPIFPQ